MMLSMTRQTEPFHLLGMGRLDQWCRTSFAMHVLAEAVGMVSLETWTCLATVLTRLPMLGSLCTPLLITVSARP
jgi:hypothetical protein